MIKHNWPTREEWARERQLPYWDCETGCPFSNKYSHRLSDYATSDEIMTAIFRLEELWRRHGREMRVIRNERTGVKWQRTGEDEAAYGRRLIAIAAAEAEIANLRFRRHH